jgi:hypothetical protein
MTTTAQLGADDVVGMTPEQIAAAVHDGRLNAYLGRPVPAAVGDGQLTEQQLTAMSPEQIADAYTRGRCDRLLGRPTP